MFKDGPGQEPAISQPGAQKGERVPAGPPRPESFSPDGLVLRCAAFSDLIRWQPGDRLEHLFEQRCDELELEGRGDAIAVEHAAGELSYRQLDARANQLARHLLSRREVLPGARVALLFDDPLQSYVAVLAILKAHAAYVPLDPAFPADRISYIAADAGVTLVLTQLSLSPRLAELPEGCRTLCLDEVELEIAGERDQRLEPDELGEAGDGLCYVIYTSGTTGRPKGVAVHHASICNFVRVASEVYGVRADDRVYQGLTIAFDFSVEEIWVAWMAGATLVPKPTGPPLLGVDLHEFLTEAGVTALCCVPTLLATLEEDLPRLRFLLVSGESCPQDLVDRWYRPERRFLNVYGPTEATVSATWTLLHPDRPVTIGVPLPTYSAVVLDPEADRALPPGTMGELGIAGIGLAEGYLGRPELTGKAFIPDFLGLSDNPSGRIYRTGDLVRFSPDGEIEHHGRIDTQVKIRGYRIEVTEIEAVLRQVPGIAQAVVDGQELSSGSRELVAYYSPRPGGGELDPDQIYASLRERLPAYMVPAYLEPLSEIPLMPSGKADRRALPRPQASRRRAVTGETAAPASPIEEVLSRELAGLLGEREVSVESDFFAELGANSLLMARFAARLREAALGLPAVSIRDVYLHPTVRRLATLLEGEGGQEKPSAPPAAEPELPAPRGTPHHRLCGALQLLTFVVYISLAGAALDIGASWLFAAHGALELYLRSLVIGTGLLAASGLLPIAAKWILIGRFRPARIRAWSFAYLRFWLVKTLSVANPLPHLLVGTCLYPVYLRAMGAKVGRGTLILSQHLPVATDLLTIGDGAVIHKDAYFQGYRARAGMIEIGATEIGAGAWVGERTVLDIHTRLGDQAQLGHSSSLQAGQDVPGGRCWYGTPAEPAPPEIDYRTVEPRPADGMRAARFAAGRLVMLLLVLGPLEAAVGALLLTHPGFLERISLIWVPITAGAILVIALAAGLILSIGLSRLLSRGLRPGRVYPIYGWHFSLQRIIARASNNSALTGLFGDSVAIVHYLRWLGYRFGVVEQTGSNFGLDVKQEVPSLSHIGTGTMVSDGLSMINAEFSSTSFRVMPVVIGPRNYIGNGISFPAQARTGEDCLFATKAMVPIAGPERSGVGLLGSPCFEIPRSVVRDRQFEHLSTGPERARRLAAKTRHNLVTMALHLLVDYVLIAGVILFAWRSIDGAGSSNFVATIAATGVDLLLLLSVFVLAERAVTGFKALKPRYCSIYQIEFWRHERFWKVAPTSYVHVFDGTPFKPLLWRALGVPIGRRVLDDGLTITERTLVRIGDESTFNIGTSLQSHTLEDGTFKSDHINVGARCTVGIGALVNYGVEVEDDSVLDPDSFLMKGSRMPAGSRWGKPRRRHRMPCPRPVANQPYRQRT